MPGGCSTDLKKPKRVAVNNGPASLDASLRYTTEAFATLQQTFPETNHELAYQ
jgi:hypothetical protein